MRKKILNIMRIVVSVGLVVYVCTKIRVNDTVVEKDGTKHVGRITVQEDTRIVIREDGREVVVADVLGNLARDGEGNVQGVHRGIVSVLSTVRLSWFIPTFLFVGLVPVIGSLRLRLLLGIQGVEITRRRALGLTFVGVFFNNLMLGLTGGDVVKAYYVAKETHKKTEAVVTVFLDRIVGLIALVVLGVVMVVVNLGDPLLRRASTYVWLFMVMAAFTILVLYSRKARRKVHVTVAAVATAGGVLILGARAISYIGAEGLAGWHKMSHYTYIYLAVMAVVWVVALVRPLRHLMGLHRVRIRLAKSRLVREMDDAFHVFSRRPARAAAAFLISILCHFITIGAVYGFARSLGIDTVPFRYFLVFVPVITMIAAAPVSLAGWGVQEAVYQMFFAGVGVGATEAITLSFIYRLCAAVLWSLPGGVVLMLRKDRVSMDEVEHAMSEKGPASDVP